METYNRSAFGIIVRVGKSRMMWVLVPYRENGSLEYLYDATFIYSTLDHIKYRVFKKGA